MALSLATTSALSFALSCVTLRLGVAPPLPGVASRPSCSLALDAFFWSDACADPGGGGPFDCVLDEGGGRGGLELATEDEDDPGGGGAARCDRDRSTETESLR